MMTLYTEVWRPEDESMLLAVSFVPKLKKLKLTDLKEAAELAEDPSPDPLLVLLAAGAEHNLVELTDPGAHQVQVEN